MKINYFICTKILKSINRLGKYLSFGKISRNPPAKKITENYHVYFSYVPNGRMVLWPLDYSILSSGTLNSVKLLQPPEKGFSSPVLDRL